MDKDKIEMKTLMESAAVAEYLTQLAKGFKNGVIVVEKDGESLTLTPTETAEVEVEARVKKDKARFSLEVSWRTAQTMDEPSSLKISAETAEAAKAAKCGDKLCGGKPAEKSGEKPGEKPGEKKDEKKAIVPVAAKPATQAVKPAASAPSSVSVVKPAAPASK